MIVRGACTVPNSLVILLTWGVLETGLLISGSCHKRSQFSPISRVY